MQPCSMHQCIQKQKQENEPTYLAWAYLKGQIKQNQEVYYLRQIKHFSFSSKTKSLTQNILTTKWEAALKF